MHNDHYDVAQQTGYYSDREPFEEQLPGLAKVQVWRGIYVLLRPIVVTGGQWLPTRPQLLRMVGTGVAVAAGGGDAVDGEGDEVEEQQDDGICDLGGLEDPGGGGIGHPAVGGSQAQHGGVDVVGGGALGQGGDTGPGTAGGSEWMGCVLLGRARNKRVGGEWVEQRSCLPVWQWQLPDAAKK